MSKECSATKPELNVRWIAPLRRALAAGPDPAATGCKRASLFPREGSRTTSTGRVLRLRTACAIEPSTARAIPVEPRAPMQITSASKCSADSQITPATSVASRTRTELVMARDSAAAGIAACKLARAVLLASPAARI